MTSWYINILDYSKKYVNEDDGMTRRSLKGILKRLRQDNGVQCPCRDFVALPIALTPHKFI